MVLRGIQAPLSRGVGRYFDALGSLFLSRPVSRFEGQVALEWNFAADARERGAYPFELAVDEGVRTLDLRPLVRAATADFLGGARALRDLGPVPQHPRRSDGGDGPGARPDAAGALPVVLTGGCFQNALLTERVLAALDARVFGLPARRSAARRRRPRPRPGGRRRRGRAPE